MDISERLRSETRAEHEALEAIGLSDKIMGATLAPEEYKRLIMVQYLVHRELEERLAQEGIQQHFPDLDFEERQKLPLLEKDLDQLRVNREEIARMSPVGKLPDLTSPHQLLGTMYVMEGATLGGMVIMKALKKNEQLTGIDNFYYYGCYGGDTGKQWKSFQKVLQQEAQTDEAKDQITAAASQTFRFFRDNFMEYLQR
jgi:heme oxygenase